MCEILEDYEKLEKEMMEVIQGPELGQDKLELLSSKILSLPKGTDHKFTEKSLEILAPTRRTIVGEYSFLILCYLLEKNNKEFLDDIIESLPTEANGQFKKESLKIFIEDDPNVLHWAVVKGYRDIIKKIIYKLSRDDDGNLTQESLNILNQKYKECNNVLSLVAEYNDAEFVATIIEALKNKEGKFQPGISLMLINFLSCLVNNHKYYTDLSECEKKLLKTIIDVLPKNEHGKLIPESLDILSKAKGYGDISFLKLLTMKCKDLCKEIIESFPVGDKNEFTEKSLCVFDNCNFLTWAVTEGDIELVKKIIKRLPEDGNGKFTEKSLNILSATNTFGENFLNLAVGKWGYKEVLETIVTKLPEDGNGKFTEKSLNILRATNTFSDNFLNLAVRKEEYKEVLETIVTKLPEDGNGKFTKESLEILSARNRLGQNFLNLAVRKGGYKEVLETIINKLPEDGNGKFTEKSLNILSATNRSGDNFLNLAVRKEEYKKVLETIINKLPKDGNGKFTEKSLKILSATNRSDDNNFLMLIAQREDCKDIFEKIITELLLNDLTMELLQSIKINEVLQLAADQYKNNELVRKIINELKDKGEILNNVLRLTVKEGPVTLLKIIIEELKKGSFDILNVKDTDNNSLLVLAAQNGNLESLEELIELLPVEDDKFTQRSLDILANAIDAKVDSTCTKVGQIGTDDGKKIGSIGVEQNTTNGADKIMYDCDVSDDFGVSDDYSVSDDCDVSYDWDLSDDYDEFTDDYGVSDGYHFHRYNTVLILAVKIEGSKEVLETIINKLPEDGNGKFTEKSLNILSATNTFGENFLNLAVGKWGYKEVLETIVTKLPEDGNGKFTEESLNILSATNTFGENFLNLAVGKEGYKEVLETIINKLPEDGNGKFTEKSLNILRATNTFGQNFLNLAVGKEEYKEVLETIVTKLPEDKGGNLTQQSLKALQDITNSVLNLENKKDCAKLVGVIAKTIKDRKGKVESDILIKLNNALMLAVKENNKDVVKSLLENGLNPNISDDYGNAPMFYAKLYGNAEIIKLLEEHGAVNMEYDLEQMILESYFGYSFNKKINEEGGLVSFNPEYIQQQIFQIMRLRNLFFMALALKDTELLKFFEDNGITEGIAEGDLFHMYNLEMFRQNRLQVPILKPFIDSDTVHTVFGKFMDYKDETSEDREIVRKNKELLKQHLKRIIPIVLSKISDYQINRFKEGLVPYINKLKELGIEGFDADIVRYNIETAISALFDANSTIEQKWNAKKILAQNLKLLKECYKKSFGKSDLVTDGYLMLSSICSAKSKDELINALFGVIGYQIELMYTNKEFEIESNNGAIAKKTINVGQELREKGEGKTLEDKVTESRREKETSEEEYRKLIEKLYSIPLDNGMTIFRTIRNPQPKKSSEDILTDGNTIGRPEIGIFDKNISDGLYLGIIPFSCIATLISTSMLAYHSCFFGMYYESETESYNDGKNYVFSVFFVTIEDLEKIYRSNREGEVVMSNLPLDYRIFNIVLDENAKISLDFSSIAKSMCFKYNKVKLIEFFKEFKSGFDKLDPEKQQEIITNLTPEQQNQLKQLLIISIFGKNEEEQTDLESKTFDELIKTFDKLIESLSALVLKTDMKEFVYLTKQQLEAIVLVSQQIFVSQKILNISEVNGKPFDMPLWTNFLQNLHMERTLDLLKRETKQLKIEGEQLETAKTQLEEEIKQQNQEDPNFKPFKMNSELLNLIAKYKLQFNPFTGCFIKEESTSEVDLAEDTDSESVVVVKQKEEQPQKTFVIPDVHGNLECFLQNLINMGAIDVIEGQYIYFQKDPNQHVILDQPSFIEPSDYKKNSGNYVKIPLFVIKKEFLEGNSKIVQVGDLVDKGEKSTECLVLSSLLSKQLGQNYTTIIGNHELAKLQGLYLHSNDTQKQLILDMIKSGNMVCMQHIPGSNNIYSHVPLFKKNISYFVSRLFGVEPKGEHFNFPKDDMTISGNKTNGSDPDNEEGYNEKYLQEIYGEFSQQHQEQLFRLSVVSKLLEKLKKDETTLDDINSILNAKIKGTEENQIISEIIKELKLFEPKDKDKIEILQQCLKDLQSEITLNKDKPFDCILDIFVNTSNQLVRDFVSTFIHGSTVESESRAEKLHIDFLLTSIISETFFGQIERKRCPVIPYKSGSLAGKNLTVKMPEELSKETYSSIVDVCGHDSFPYYSGLDGESKREGYGTTDYLNGCGILWTDEQQGERERRKYACYYEIEKQLDGITTYNACRTRSDITLDEIQEIPCSKRYKVSMKEADKSEIEYEGDVGAIDDSETPKAGIFEDTTKPSVDSSEALAGATMAVAAVMGVAANLVVNANLFEIVKIAEQGISVPQKTDKYRQ